MKDELLDTDFGENGEKGTLPNLFLFIICYTCVGTLIGGAAKALLLKFAPYHFLMQYDWKREDVPTNFIVTQGFLYGALFGLLAGTLLMIGAAVTARRKRERLTNQRLWTILGWMIAVIILTHALGGFLFAIVDQYSWLTHGLVFYPLELHGDPDRFPHAWVIGGAWLLPYGVVGSVIMGWVLLSQEARRKPWMKI